MSPSVLVDLVHLDDVAVRIVKENLVPAVHRTLAPVGIGDALCLEMRLAADGRFESTGVGLPALRD